MAIDPTAFFALQNQVQTENRLRDQSDINLSNSFMGLSSLVVRLTQELGMMTSIVSSGQRQENSLLTSLTQGQELITKGVLGKTVQPESVGGILDATGAGRVTGGAGGGMSSLLGGGLAFGGLTGILGSVLGGGEPSLEPGSVPGGSLGTEKLVSLAKGAGFNDQDAVTMAAIAMAESGGKSGAINDNPKTGDLSYGLWQINMIGKLGPARRKEFGIESNEQLLDPATNANAAKKVKDSSGFSAWSVYKSGDYKQFLPSAQEALKKSQSSAKPSGTSTSQSSQVSSEPTREVNVASQLKPSQSSSVAQITQTPEETSQGMIAAVPSIIDQKNYTPSTRGSSQTTGDPFSGNPLSTISALSMGIQVG